MPTDFSICLFDLDLTLLPIDSDHAWGEFMIREGWVDETTFRARNDAFYRDYLAGRLDIHAYVDFTTHAFRDRDAAEQRRAQARFMQSVIEPQIKTAARDLVESHRARGDRIALVTATNEFVTAPIARAFGIETLIAVKLERAASGTITGRIDGVPSYREGKVVRVGQWLDSLGVDWASATRISVYSDSPNDLPLLERATEPVATNPSPDLERTAKERGWRILKLFE